MGREVLVAAVGRLFGRERTLSSIAAVRDGGGLVTEFGEVDCDVAVVGAGPYGLSESSTPGLHFLGAPAAWSYGPTMRFVSGSWYASAALTTHLKAHARAR
jgi:hypothetical protein